MDKKAAQKYENKKSRSYYSIRIISHVDLLRNKETDKLTKKFKHRFVNIYLKNYRVRSISIGTVSKN
jgi:hypothetical protein